MIFVKDWGTVNRVPQSALTLPRDMDATTSCVDRCACLAGFFSRVQREWRETERRRSLWLAGQQFRLYSANESGALLINSN